MFSVLTKPMTEEVGSIKKSILLAFAASAILLAGCKKVTLPAPTTTGGQQSTSSSQQAAAQVTYDGTSFSPSTIEIKKGDTVTWTNSADDQMWVASDPHPIHTGYGGFDALAGTAKGGRYSFTFEKTGTFGYHNHLNSAVKGTVVVK